MTKRMSLFLAFFSFIFTACSHDQDPAIRTAILIRENHKGNVISSSEIISKKDSPSYVKVQYKAYKNDKQEILDSITLFVTGDGMIGEEKK